MSDVITIENVRGVAVVAFKSGAMLDLGKLQQAETELLEVVVGEHKKIIIDFDAVDSLSSQALTLLLNLRRTAQTHGTRVALSHLRPKLVNVFRMTNLDRLFGFFDSNEAAIESFADTHRRE
ncbi:MAG: STAS domain-containing protein [Phycisphaerae bacterium]|nr:STAS domain-containing protein [Phycisphaerae bacterium]